ncbi:MAG: hypothetical protein HYV63_24550 [Candidatus Schekmanbacteria bacterium]|nr:hypothetical protein [Candidatus Schekmanbacteria bacterium]
MGGSAIQQVNRRANQSPLGATMSSGSCCSGAALTVLLPGASAGVWGARASAHGAASARGGNRRHRDGNGIAIGHRRFGRADTRPGHTIASASRPLFGRAAVAVERAAELLVTDHHRPNARAPDAERQLLASVLVRRVGRADKGLDAEAIVWPGRVSARPTGH